MSIPILKTPAGSDCICGHDINIDSHFLAEFNKLYCIICDDYCFKKGVPIVA